MGSEWSNSAKANKLVNCGEKIRTQVWEFTLWAGVTRGPYLPVTFCWGPTPGQALHLVTGDTGVGVEGCSYPLTVPWAPARSSSFPRIVTHPTKSVIRDCTPHVPGIPDSRLDFLSSEHRGTRREPFLSCSPLLLFGFLWILKIWPFLQNVIIVWKRGGL